MPTAPPRSRSPRARRPRHLPLRAVRSPRDLGRLDPLAVLRVVLVGCQAAQVHVTWRLWAARDLPPRLPLVSALPDISMGWLLIASLVPVVLRPRWGIPLHVATLAFALALDQLRLQPEWISLAVLLVATGPWRLSRTLAWSSLSSLWLWAGLTKALSTGFTVQTVEPIVHRFGIDGLRPVVAVLIPVAEIGVGLAAAWPRTRRLAGWAGLALHVGIIVGLDMRLDWPILWWNLGLAAASVLLLTVGPGERPARSPRAAGTRTALVAFLFVYPAGSYLGLVDPYLGHHVYTGDLTRAEVCVPDVGCDTYMVDITGAAIGVPFPGAHRLYRQWFRSVCEPGWTMQLTGLAVRPPLDRLAGAADDTVACHRA